MLKKVGHILINMKNVISKAIREIPYLYYRTNQLLLRHVKIFNCFMF